MLKAIITADEHKALPADVQGHYTEKDGKHVLDVGAVDGMELANTVNLKSALQTERGAKETAEKKAKELTTKFEGIDDPAAAIEAMKKVAEMGDWDPDKKLAEAKTQFEKQLSDKYANMEKSLTKKHADETDVLTKRLETQRGQLQKSLIGSAAVKAISEAGGSAELLLPIVERQAQMRELDDGQFVVEVLDAEGKARISPESGSTAAMTISELIAELKQDEKFGRAFDGSSASGSGAGRTGGTGVKPGSKVLPKGEPAVLGANLERIAKGEAVVE